MPGGAVEAAVEDARGGLLAGLIFIGHDDLSAPPALVAQVLAHRIPFVALDCGERDAPYATVDFDYATGVRQAVAHLAEQQVTEVLYVRPDLDSRAEIQRERALADELSARGDTRLTVLSDGITAEKLETLDAHPGSLADHITRLRTDIERALRASSDPDLSRTAVLCAWGSDVEAAYRAAHAVGGVHVASLAAGTLELDLWPNLFSSRLPLEEAGRACADLIVAEVAGRAESPHLLLAPTPAASATTIPLSDTGGRP